MNTLAKSHKELSVYRNAVEASMEIFWLSKGFPAEEKYSMTDQIRRCSRSVCANLSEAWRKRRYQAAFVAKLNDAESEACEVQTWIELANRCGYIDAAKSTELDLKYEQIIRQLVTMISGSSSWIIR